MVWTTIESLITAFHRRLCPLYSFDKREHAYLRGSAIPFDVNGFRFLLSARHVCFSDSGTPEPLFTVGERRFPWPLTALRGTWESIPGRTVDIDLAVIGLSEECAEDLSRFYWFATPADTTTFSVTRPNTAYLIAGYPYSRNRIRVKGRRADLPARATCLVTPYAHESISFAGSDKGTGRHFALTIPEAPIRRAGGGDFVLPQPAGMSGGGVWHLNLDSTRRLVGNVALIGIGIEFHRRHNAFIATRVQSAIPLAHDLRTLLDVDGHNLLP